MTRRELVRAIEVLIELLDEIDGDPDAEAEEDFGEPDGMAFMHPPLTFTVIAGRAE